MSQYYIMSVKYKKTALISEEYKSKPVLLFVPADISKEEFLAYDEDFDLRTAKVLEEINPTTDMKPHRILELDLT